MRLRQDGVACLAIATDALFVSGVTDPAATLAGMRAPRGLRLRGE